MEDAYLQAALAFLECDKLKHDVKFVRYAASFLKRAKKSNDAGLLYAKLSRVSSVSLKSIATFHMSIYFCSIKMQ